MNNSENKTLKSLKGLEESRIKILMNTVCLCVCVCVCVCERERERERELPLSSLQGCKESKLWWEIYRAHKTKRTASCVVYPNQNNGSNTFNIIGTGVPKF